MRVQERRRWKEEYRCETVREMKDRESRSAWEERWKARCPKQVSQSWSVKFGVKTEWKISAEKFSVYAWNRTFMIRTLRLQLCRRARYPYAATTTASPNYLKLEKVLIVSLLHVMSVTASFACISFRWKIHFLISNLRRFLFRVERTQSNSKCFKKTDCFKKMNLNRKLFLK